MRPLQLTMQAFGPYAGTEKIDFTKLENRTMFVISGKTGAGKTTIFDGISYAIFGKASGDDRNGPDLRSQFSHDSTPTEVSLLFSLRGETYSISRAPQQDKKKERGEGFTTVGAKAELYKIEEDGSQKLLGSNVREVDEKIKEIVQLDANQFRQILMIPQGEFRKLLVSDSKDKEQILQRLFHTEFYKKIEEKLKEEAAELKRSVERQIVQRNSLLQQLHSGNDPELDASLKEEQINDHLIIPLAHKAIEAMEVDSNSMKETVENLQKKRDELQKSIYQAEDLHQQAKQKNEFEARKNELESKKEEMEKKKQDIAFAYKASRLQQQEELCLRLRKDYDENVKRLNQIKGQKIEVEKALEAALENYLKEEKREDERNLAAEKVSYLNNMKEEIKTFDSLQSETNRLQQEHENAVKKRDESKKSLEELDSRTELLKVRKESVEKARYAKLEYTAELEKLDHQLQLLDKLTNSIIQSEANRKNVILVEEKVQKFSNALNDAKETLNYLENKWRHGQAGLLAKELVNGDACPVCGSNHHPQPALIDENIPTESDLNAAKESVRLADADKAKVENELYQVNARLEMLQESIKEMEDSASRLIPHFQIDFIDSILQEVKVKQESLKAELQKVNAAVEEEEKIKQQTAAAESARMEMLKRLEELEKLHSMSNEHFIEKRTELQRVKESIPEELRSMDAFQVKLAEAINQKLMLEQSMEKARKRHQELKETFSGIQSKMDILHEAVSKSEQSLKEERENFKTMLDEQGFSTYQDYAGAKNTETEIQALENELKDYGEELRSVTDRCHELALKLKDKILPDLAMLQESFKELSSELGQKQDELTNLAIRIKENKSILAKVNVINSEMKEAENRYQVIGHLSDMARGQNTYRLTFERFVLASFLDEILKIANGRLSKMTSGRYQLLRKTDRSKGNVQSGLELLIFDQYTGQERHVKTLSGGESFKASLALALGLADVVQQHAGGVSLETMFIDEGFGTLDPESLDNAIDALMDIQNSGRLVGVISHVPELKERIDARLEVISSQSGSCTEFRFIG
ncbi:AAA family ATPase [Falsibacillus pallidus]|uniref:Nuclease SbcCD subunit C n=1 Tax=Falsibacillus pallidus TaxID=493781 RepID=A0A370GTY8_9BACI|nr:AAA family ATPase [Falsibacillus pallidus]RDI45393.1 exonuclease SbcC [Falsibacillus pallidus]